MPKLYTLILSLLLMQTVSAQMPVLQWGKTFESKTLGEVTSNGRKVAVDSAGNVYTVGLLNFTMDMDPGPGEYLLTGDAANGHGVYISKLDANGKFVWAQAIQIPAQFLSIEMRLDEEGNIYMSSSVWLTSDINPGPGTDWIRPLSNMDIFIVKLNKVDGSLMWNARIGGYKHCYAEVTAMNIDKDGNLVVGGVFERTVEINTNMIPGRTLHAPDYARQMFIFKLRKDGHFMWAKQFGNNSYNVLGSRVLDIAFDDQGSIFPVGSFSGEADFDTGPGTFNLNAKDGSGFIMNLNANGGFRWVRQIPSSVNAIAIDSLNNIITTGEFSGNPDFDPGPATFNAASKGAIDAYILKLNKKGAFVWVKTIGGNGYTSADDIEVDKSGNIYMAGDFGTAVDFDPGPGDHTINSPCFGPSAIVKLNADGNFNYAATFPCIGSGGSRISDIVLDTARNIYVTGFVSGTTDFDPSAAVYPITATAEQSPIVLKLGYCTTKTTRQIKTICQGESFFAGGARQTAAGEYIDTLHTTQGCDSVVTTVLTVNPVPTPDLGKDSSICSHTELEISPGTFNSYLWQDGSTANNFIVNTAGEYWVKVTNNFNCTSTDTLTIAILPAPADFLKEKDTICSYESLEVASLYPYQTYQWSTGATTRNITLRQPGNYTLKVTDANGCTGTDDITLFTKPCKVGFYIPTAFTPNGDGKNDQFRPLLYGNVRQFRFSVYNRMGVLMFHTSDPLKGWDGSVSNIMQPFDVYIWICNYQFEGEGPKVEKGKALLIP